MESDYGKAARPASAAQDFPSRTRQARRDALSRRGGESCIASEGTRSRFLAAALDVGTFARPQLFSVFAFAYLRFGRRMER